MSTSAEPVVSEAPPTPLRLGAHYSVVVIGGGQAGLSISYYLKQRRHRARRARDGTASATSGASAAGTPSAW